MEKTLKLNSNEEAVALYGSLDENLRFAEKEYHVRISARNHQMKIVGDKDNIEKAYSFFMQRLSELRGTSPKTGAQKENKAQSQESSQ